jgi:hypothetical protein
LEETSAQSFKIRCCCSKNWAIVFLLSSISSFIKFNSADVRGWLEDSGLVFEGTSFCFGSSRGPGIGPLVPGFEAWDKLDDVLWDVWLFGLF